MRRNGLLALGLIAVAIGVAEEAPAVNWSNDLAAARAQAKEAGRPLLVVFR